jgi:hypothetical protein
MGIGFVLIIWFILWMGVACFCSLALGLFTWWLLRRAMKGPRFRAIAAVVLLPPVCVACGLVGFVGYGLWCETTRGVDAGIGDGWRVPLGSGYQLMMIDTMEQAYIESPKGEQCGMGMPRLGFDDHAVYFEAQRDTFGLIEKATGRLSTGLSEAELAAKLELLGSPTVRLRPPERVYSSLRWGAKDLLAIPMVLGLPVFLTLGVGSYVWRVWRRCGQRRNELSGIEHPFPEGCDRL